VKVIHAEDQERSEGQH